MFGRISFAVRGIICACEYTFGIELATIHEKKEATFMSCEYCECSMEYVLNDINLL